MMNKKFTKLMKGCALAMALAMTTVSFSAYAAEVTPEAGEVNTVKPDADNKASDPTSTGKFDPTAEDSVDTKIDVWGYTKNTVVYSVDVEWGAMTFEYEASKWDPETHKKVAGGGWKIYDEGTDKALTVEQDAINRVAVTNHSNAPVYAKMSFAGQGDYTSGTGTFTAIDEDADTDNGTANVKATWNDTDKYLTLETAATDANDAEITNPTAEGTPAKGNVYFKPTSEVAAGTEIAKWTTIGKINVAVTTEVPTATP